LLSYLSLRTKVSKVSKIVLRDMNINNYGQNFALLLLRNFTLQKVLEFIVIIMRNYVNLAIFF